VAAAERTGVVLAQAHAHRILARALLRLGRDDAHHHFDVAARLYHRAGDPAGSSLVHLGHAHVYCAEGRYDEALVHARRAITGYRSINHRIGIGKSLNITGWCLAQLGDYHEAIRHSEQALAIREEVGDRLGLSQTWDNLGYAHHHLGNYQRAITCFRQGLSLRPELADMALYADMLDHIGDAHQGAGQPDAARNAWQQALDVLNKLEHPDAHLLRTKLKALDEQPSTPVR
jgi:tetratricopeptide (TPR) repeat protein